MARKPASDSIAGRVAAAQAIDRVWDLPEGLEPLTYQEKPVWDDYTAAKTGWKQVELRTVHRIVKLETRYRELSDEKESTTLLLGVLKAIESQTRIIGLQTTSKNASASDDSGRISQGRGKAPIKGKPNLSSVVG